MRIVWLYVGLYALPGVKGRSTHCLAVWGRVGIAWLYREEYELSGCMGRSTHCLAVSGTLRIAWLYGTQSHCLAEGSAVRIGCSERSTHYQALGGAVRFTWLYGSSGLWLYWWRYSQVPRLLRGALLAGGRGRGGEAAATRCGSHKKRRALQLIININ